jgi:hypothetical protein
MIPKFASCNGDQFMQKALAVVSSGALNPPALGTGKAGICPTTRDFRIVDMDQSDNVVTTYLLINGQVLAQATPEASKNNTNAQVLTNGSDNALVNDFIDPITGCIPWTEKSPTAPSGSSPALALNELAGSKFQQNPAIVPANDPMVVIGDNNGNIQQSLQKVNLYRAAVGQPRANTIADASGTAYCKNFAISGIWIAQNQALFQGGMSPDPAAANNLYTFLAQRFAASFGPVPALGCQTIFGLQSSPVTMSTDTNGVVTAASINTNVLQQILNGQIQPGGTVVASSIPSTAASLTTTIAAASSATTTILSNGAKFTGKFPGRFSHRLSTQASSQMSSLAASSTLLSTMNVVTSTGSVVAVASTVAQRTSITRPMSMTSTSAQATAGTQRGRPQGQHRGWNGLREFLGFAW